MFILRRVCYEEKDSKYPFDSAKILPDSRDEFNKISEDLVKRYNEPDFVFVSPYAAAIETVKNLPYKVIVDPEIGKFQSNRNALLKQSTEDNLPVYDVNLEDFRSRVNHRFRRLVQIGATKVIWVVTHPDVIRHIASTQSMKDVPKEIPTNYTIAFSCSASKSVWQRVNNGKKSSSVTEKPKQNIPKKEEKDDEIEKEKEKIQRSRTIQLTSQPNHKKWCRKCKHEICRCDEFNASLDSNCRVCNIVPCMCVKISCESCGETDCDCDEMQSDFAVRSSFDAKLYK